eukprot:1271370-Prymnesium_polylepis.1
MARTLARVRLHSVWRLSRSSATSASSTSRSCPSGGACCTKPLGYLSCRSAMRLMMPELGANH